MISMEEPNKVELIEDNRISNEQILHYIWAVVRKFRERD